MLLSSEIPRAKTVGLRAFFYSSSGQKHLGLWTLFSSYNFAYPIHAYSAIPLSIFPHLRVASLPVPLNHILRVRYLRTSCAICKPPLRHDRGESENTDGPDMYLIQGVEREWCSIRGTAMDGNIHSVWEGPETWPDEARDKIWGYKDLEIEGESLGLKGFFGFRKRAAVRRRCCCCCCCFYL